MKRLRRILCWFTGHWYSHEAALELGRLVRTSTCRFCGEVRRTEFI